MAYKSKDAIRAGNAWYQAFTQDIIDDKSYAKLEMPVLGVAGPGYNWLNAILSRKATNQHVIKIEKCGHFIAEEQPEEMTRLLIAFLQD
ncbi:MAG: alpha/beta hydrolase [Limisphaerales bacterium]